MPSTRLLAVAAAVLAAAATAAPAAATTADLTVTAAASDGTHAVAAQRLADGTAVLALPRDGVARSFTLDASGSQDASGFAFDLDASTHSDDCGCASVSRDPRHAVSLALDTPRTSAVQVYGPLQQTASASLTWRAVFQPRAQLAAPATATAPTTITFDAAASQAFAADGSTRPVAAYRWDLDGAPGFERTTDDPRVSQSAFAAGDRCATVIAVDVSGAASDPASACTSVAPQTTAQSSSSPPVVSPSAVPPPVTATNQTPSWSTRRSSWASAASTAGSCS